MVYLFLIIIGSISIMLHYHYYRWCIFNPSRVNTPIVYRSATGDIIVWISKLLVLAIIIIFFEWYHIFWVFLTTAILKRVAFRKSLQYIKQEYMQDGHSEVEAKGLALAEIKNKYRR